MFFNNKEYRPLYNVVTRGEKCRVEFLSGLSTQYFAFDGEELSSRRVKNANSNETDESSPSYDWSSPHNSAIKSRYLWRKVEATPAENTTELAFNGVLSGRGFEVKKHTITPVIESSPTGRDFVTPPGSASSPHPIAIDFYARSKAVESTEAPSNKLIEQMPMPNVAMKNGIVDARHANFTWTVSGMPPRPDGHGASEGPKAVMKCVFIDKDGRETESPVKTREPRLVDVPSGLWFKLSDVVEINKPCLVEFYHELHKEVINLEWTGCGIRHRDAGPMIDFTKKQQKGYYWRRSTQQGERTINDIVSDYNCRAGGISTIYPYSGKFDSGQIPRIEFEYNHSPHSREHVERVIAACINLENAIKGK